MRANDCLLLPTALLSIVLFCGCESTEDIMPIRVDPTPLVVDPTEDISVAGWWRGDDRLIHLQPRGSYIVYEGHSRYGHVVERGRWGQLSYAHITLEPYRVLDAATQRWTLTRIDNTLTLERAGQTLERLEGEPRSAEDDIIGTWSSPSQTLTLAPDMRCVWRRSQNDMRDVHGRWMLQDTAVILKFDASDSPVEVAIIREEDGESVVSLVTPSGELHTRTES